MKTLRNVLLFLVITNVSNALLQAQNGYAWQWINQFGSDGLDQIQGIACSNDNETYVTGNFYSTLIAGTQSIQAEGWDDIFLACFDNTGSLLSLERGGGKNYDAPTCITMLNNNDLILCGLVTDTITMGNLKSESTGRRLFITKRTQAGPYVWLTTLIPSSSYSASLFLVDSDDNGNIYAAGFFKGSLTCQGYTVTSNGGKDIYIVKLNPDGMVMNFMSYGGSQDDEITAMSVSPSGKIIIAGSPGSDFSIGPFRITADVRPSSGLSSDPFILCFNNDFSASWKTQLNGVEYCTISGLAQDQNENTYAIGSYNIQANIGGSLYYSEGYSDAFLVKYDSDGNYKWSRSFGSWYYDYSKDLITEPDGSTIVAGTMGDTIQIDNLLLSPSEVDISSAFLVEFSADGTATWGKCVTGEGRIQGKDAEFDQNGNLYFTGSFDNNIESQTDTLITIGDDDVFLAYFLKCFATSVEISGNDYLCPGLTAELSINGSYSNIFWSNEVLDQPKITIDQPGLYSVLMTYANGCTQTDSIEVTLAETENFTLGEDISMPVGNSLLLNAPENFENFVWQDGSTGTSYLASAENNESGLYTFWLSAEDLQGCPVHDTIEIEFYIETAVNNPANSELKIYPIPANDFLYLTYKPRGSGNDFTLQLLDLEGRIIVTNDVINYVPGTVIQLDVNSITSGLYIISIKEGNQCFNLLCRIRH